MMDFKSKSRIIDMTERIPIVYTTKLEEMDTFMTNVTDMNVDSVIDSIIKESKPECNLRRKRKLRPSHFTYEDLSSCINALNRKIARKAEISKNDPSSLCKPVKVVLQDLKYLLRRAPQRNEIKKSNENIQKPNLMDWYKPTIKTRPYTSEKSKIIYDAQSKEYDLYLFDSASLIKQYTRIQANNSNSKLFLTFKEDKPFLKVMCCCWYNREWYVKSQTKHHRLSIKFMRKEHRCTGTADLCHCCCRTKNSIVQNTSLKEVTIMNTNTQINEASSHKILEAPFTWFNRVTGTNLIAERIPSTSLTEFPEVNQTDNFVEENLPILRTTNIQFGEEFYEIGAEGQLKLFYKSAGNDSRPFIMPPSANNILGDNICCWYKREKFAACLLELGALPNFVKFLRLPHLCSVTNCNCCCKPITNQTTLVILPVTIRHTNNLNSTINPVKTLNANPVSNVSPRTDATPSFYISMTAMNILSNTTDRALMRDVLNEIIPETDVLDRKSVVRFIIDKSGPKCKIVVEGVDLNSITTKELRILDIIFRVIESRLLKERKPTTVIPKPRSFNNAHNPLAVEQPAVETSNICKINPSLYLNEQVSLIMDLRYKRFLPSLRDHLKMFELPDLKDISEWLDRDSSTTDTCIRNKSPNEIGKPSLLHKFLKPIP